MSGVETLSARKRALLEEALRRRRAAAAPPGIPRRSETGPAPLSFPQSRMWFLQEWDREAPTFNGVRAVRLRGPLDAGALRAALHGVAERHESLRTVIEQDGAEPRQRLLESWSVELPLLDLSGRPREQAERELAPLVRELARRPFDLSRDVMLRPTLVRLAGDQHVLVIALHHVAFDAFSDRVLYRELAELYAAARGGREPELEPLPIQYADFAVWQRDQLQGAELRRLVDYWTGQLAGAPVLLPLPADHPRRAVQRHDGSQRRFQLDAELARGVEELARAEATTLYVVLLAAFTTLLYRVSGEEDVVVGTPIANRSHRELEGLIGFFSNTIAIRTRLGGNPPFREVVRRVRESALGGFAHQDLPFEKAVEALRLPRDPSHHPLFQVNFRAHAGARESLELEGLECEPLPVDIGFSRFDLALELEVRESGIGGFFEYDQDLFDPDTVDGLVAVLRTLLEQALREPATPVLALALPARERARRRPRTAPAAATTRRRAI